MPNRIQRKRTKGWRMPSNTVFVGRPTRFGNPYKVSDIQSEGEVSIQEAHQQAVNQFKSALIQGRLAVSVDEVISMLKGKDLACWCSESIPCHVDVLLDIANNTETN